MKNINWDKNPNSYPSFVGSRKPNGTLSGFFDPIKSDMSVEAQYKGFEIHLKIISEISENKYTALVTSIKSFDDDPPEDLFINDEVLIDREFICSISFP